MDIELRFVLRAVPTPEYGEGMSRFVPVLQYRNGVSTPPGTAWCAWTDVPTGTESFPEVGEVIRTKRD